MLLHGAVALNTIPGITALPPRELNELVTLARLVPFFVDAIPDRSDYENRQLAAWADADDRRHLWYQFEAWTGTGLRQGLITWRERSHYLSLVERGARREDTDRYLSAA